MRRVLLTALLLLLTQCMAPDVIPPNPQQIRRDWVADTQAQVGSHLTYPSLPAEERPMRFAVTGLQYTVDAAGTVTDAQIARSSGYPRLDEAALQGLLKASPLPPPPANLLGADGKAVARASFRFGS
jgi:protein TonB